MEGDEEGWRGMRRGGGCHSGLDVWSDILTKWCLYNSMPLLLIA